MICASKFIATIILLSFSCSAGYEAVGCYKDTSNRAIQTLEGKDSILDGSYTSRANPIAKCAMAAMRAGYSMFAVQDGGWCAASATAPQTFDKFGKSTACMADGEGGPWANEVYLMKGRLRKLQTITCLAIINSNKKIYYCNIKLQYSKQSYLKVLFDNRFFVSRLNYFSLIEFFF